MAYYHFPALGWPILNKYVLGNIGQTRLLGQWINDAATVPALGKLVNIGG